MRSFKLLSDPTAKNLTPSTAAITFLIALPFSIFWFIFFMSLSFGLANTSGMVIFLYWLSLGILFYEIIVGIPSLIIAKLTHTKELQTLVIAHIPGLLAFIILVVGSLL